MAKNFARDYEKKNNTRNIRCLVDESFVPATQRPRVSYWRLSDFMSQPRSTRLAGPLLWKIAQIPMKLVHFGPKINEQVGALLCYSMYLCTMVLTILSNCDFSCKSEKVHLKWWNLKRNFVIWHQKLFAVRNTTAFFQKSARLNRNL